MVVPACGRELTDSPIQTERGAMPLPKQIGKLIASKIPNGASLFIDIGTTMASVAEALISHQNLKIITNHIDVVYTLCEKTDFEIILTGGLVRNRDRAIWDDTTAEFPAALQS